MRFIHVAMATLMERQHACFKTRNLLPILQSRPATRSQPLPLVQNAANPEPVLLPLACQWPGPDTQPLSILTWRYARMIAGPIIATQQHIECAERNDQQQYGVLPWRMGRQGDMRVLLITDRNQKNWGVPKGWPVEGRVPFMSAALDAFEEAGIIGDIDPQPLTHYGYASQASDGTSLAHHVTLFAMRVRGTLLHWKEHGQRQRRWFSASEAADRLENTELAGFVRQLVTSPGPLIDSAGRLTVNGGT